MRAIPRSILCLVLVGACLLGAPSAGAQSVVDRTPNLSGGWVGPRGTAYFNFLHRFEHGQPPVRKVTNFPTFLMGYTPVNGLLLAAHYATNSDLVANYPNEWEFFARWAGLDLGPARVALTGGWNHAAESLDGEASLRVVAGRLALLGVARGFSAGYGGDARFVVGGGAVLGLGSNVALAGDVVTLTDRSAAEEVAWSAGLQLRIPYTPHSLSLHASNTNTATLEGSSRGGDVTRYGFEFTIPISLSRYLNRGPGAPAVMTTADTIVVTIRDFDYSPASVTIRPGATVVFVNEGAIGHTATADDGSWDTGMINPGARASHTFPAGGGAYHCAPHPFMKGAIVVSGGER